MLEEIKTYKDWQKGKTLDTWLPFYGLLASFWNFDSFDAEMQARGDKHAGVNYIVPHCDLIRSNILKLNKLTFGFSVTRIQIDLL
jgi:hypothetical protein